MWWFLISLLFVARTVEAQTPSLAKTSELVQAGSAIRLPGLVIHGGDSKFIEATGTVALTNGILEFIAVEQEGRDYESLFSLESKPSALQFALLLIGAEPGAPPHQAKPGEKQGDRLLLDAEWVVGNKPKRVPVHQLLIDRRTNKPPPELPWVFTGSFFIKDIAGRDLFQADAEQAFVSLWWNPAIPINPGGDFGNPYRGDEQGFRANTRLLPPRGTPIKLLLRKADSNPR